MLPRYRYLPLVRQAEATECAHACLAMIAGWHGHQIDLVSMRLHHAASANGTSLHTLAVLAEQFSLRARALRLEPGDLARLALPAILHWDMNHFVVLKSVGRRGVTIHDPARGVIKLSLQEVGQHFTGVAMEFSPVNAAHEEFSTPLSHRQFYPQEWEALLHYNGFTVTGLFGDFAAGPFDRQSDVMIWHAQVSRKKR